MPDQAEDAGGDLPIHEIGKALEDDSTSIDGVIAESFRESVEAAEQWTFERTLEFVADAVHPGAGRLISIVFTIKEVFSDAEAVASPDSPRNVHVPLLHVAGGLAVDLDVHLPGADGSGDDAPPLSGFLAPGDDGLFGGWAIEVDRDAEPDGKEAPESEEDAHTTAAEQVTRPSVEQTDRAKRPESPGPPLIDDDLSSVVRRVKEPWRRAVVLREAAWLLRARLYARREFAAEALLVIYDPLTGVGMWLADPGLPDALVGRRIVIWRNPTTGMILVYVN